MNVPWWRCYLPSISAHHGIDKEALNFSLLEELEGGSNRLAVTDWWLMHKRSPGLVRERLSGWGGRNATAIAQYSWKTFRTQTAKLLPSIVGKTLTAEIAFGNVLREVRKARGLSQEALAAEANVERNYISLLELGHNSVSIRVLFQLAAALGVPASELLRRVERQLKA
jgi:DNA-binding XRE family transcriptional regulator